MDEFDYIELLDSARSVLRGVAPAGTLARIADVRARRRLAAVFMQRDANTALPWWWPRMLRDTVAGTTGYGFGSYTPPQMSCYQVADDFEPVCLNSWLRPRNVSDEVVRMRRQALRNFPVPLFQAIWTAHSDEPLWRVRAAWEVLDAVDVGRKIIAPLARFLRVSRKAIKLSTHCTMQPANMWTQYGSTRRSLRVIQAMHALDPALSIRHEFYPLVDMVMRVVHVGFHKAYAVIDSEHANSDGAMTTYGIRRAAMFGLVRRLRRKARRRLRGGVRIKATLSCGWSAQSLTSHAELRREGVALAHCVAMHWSRVEQGEMQVFALRSSDGYERATAVIEPPLGVAEEAEFTHMEIAGPHNEPFHPAVLVAIGELMQRYGASGLRVTLA